jgi:hypothetical protein
MGNSHAMFVNDSGMDVTIDTYNLVDTLRAFPFRSYAVKKGAPEIRIEAAANEYGLFVSKYIGPNITAPVKSVKNGGTIKWSQLPNEFDDSDKAQSFWGSLFECCFPYASKSE